MQSERKQTQRPSEGNPQARAEQRARLRKALEEAIDRIGPLARRQRFLRLLAQAFGWIGFVCVGFAALVASPYTVHLGLLYAAVVLIVGFVQLHLVREFAVLRNTITELDSQIPRYDVGELHGAAYLDCLLCGSRSFHPKDVASHYCGNCHVFLDHPRAT